MDAPRTAPPASGSDLTPAEIDQDSREDQELVDRILFLRSLASNGPAVERLMEALIVVTGHWKRDTPLSLRDHADMDELEAKLKYYLIYEDPAPGFTAASLADRLAEYENATPAPPKKQYGLWFVFLAVGIAMAGLAYLAFHAS